ncbi:MAG: four helix bundle protein [Candidatus Shapirobacteria bacterium]|jgi:four helix bundle protein
MKENVIQEKSFNFAIRIIKVYKYLKQNKQEFVLSKQLLRSGTSIGANVEEAIGSQSRNDFISKLSIAYKEARESSYWIKLLEKSEYLSTKESQSLLDDLTEILKIIGKIQKTLKTNS